MWLADSPTERIWVFDYDADTGAATNRRLWLDRGHAPGRPDGGTVDADGCYWSARWRGGCVVRFTPQGRVDRTIELPVEQVTMCTFGGPSLDTLYVTTARNGLDDMALARQPLAGSLFAIHTGIGGIAAVPFTSARHDVHIRQHAEEES
jgi:sugar lactone lactonase YvrE